VRSSQKLPIVFVGWAPAHLKDELDVVCGKANAFGGREPTLRFSALVGCAPHSGMKSNEVTKFERMRTAMVMFVSKAVYSKSNVSRDVLCKLARARVSKGLKPLVVQQIVAKSVYNNSNVVVRIRSNFVLRRTHPTNVQHTLEFV
jgi:hypothetical protein